MKKIMKEKKNARRYTGVTRRIVRMVVAARFFG